MNLAVGKPNKNDFSFSSMSQSVPRKLHIPKRTDEKLLDLFFVFSGMGKEVGNLLLENSQLLETK